MSNRFQFAAAVSVTLAVLTAIAWCASLFTDPRRHHLTLAENVHISVNARGLDGRLQVFNDAEYGPYRGSIVNLEGAPNPVAITGFGDCLGVYYRQLVFPSGAVLRTIAISLLYPLSVALVLPVTWLHRYWRRYA